MRTIIYAAVNNSNIHFFFQIALGGNVPPVYYEVNELQIFFVKKYYQQGTKEYFKHLLNDICSFLFLMAMQGLVIWMTLVTKCFLTGTSIGKRYARTDEIGVPLAVTVDSTTTVTIRERDSKAQVRVKIAEVASIVKQFVEGPSTWGDIQWNYPTAHGSPDENENAPEEKA
jgi:Anticodon binding domain